MSSAPAFGNIRGAGKSSLRARDAHEGGGRGGRGGRGKRLLNRGMNLKNGNYIGKRDEGGGADPGPAVVQEDDHAAEAALGFPLYTDGPERLGWLFNMNSSQKADKETGQAVSVVNCYFQCQDGSMFKAQVEYSPYFYLQVRDGLEVEVDAWLRRKFAGQLRDVETVEREDLDLKNHLSGLRRRLLKLSFWNVEQLIAVRREVQPIVARNRGRKDGTAAYAAGAGAGGSGAAAKAGRERLQEGVDAIEDIREYDVPYHVRFAIDTDTRCGHWFTVRAAGGRVSLERRPDLLQRAEPRICAFDIETTKLPLQFPNAEYDQVFMISYMLDKQGYLIINREVVSEDIGDFEYTPKPEFEGPFKVFNCANEAASLRCWFDHMRAVQPGVYVTYNGDFFDWPFIETRAAKHGMDMAAEIGFKMTKSGECLSRSAVHMDCLHWVNRDSYLPQGSRGLKAVTKYKLGYDPVEVDPEDMVRFAAERPQAMASYSVSDAVATYYLYMTYIHPFIFSLSTIIPMPPDEVLRKGSGTLCEALLMVEAFRANVVAPNKHTAAAERMHKGHLLESETYIGGKVEALESGVFRADLPCKFRTRPEAYQKLLDKLDTDLAYALKTDAKWAVEDVANYQEVRDAIAAKLTDLRDHPVREEKPLIYHLDVAAMYPNIILTNRLQPSAIVTDEDCAACDFNRPGKTCRREMEWVWRGETYSCTKAEYLSIKAQLQADAVAPAVPGGRPRTWDDLGSEERAKLLKERLKKYCQKVYKRVLDKPEPEKRQAGVCQRENGFYYDTVRAFRDRRYEYKGLNKVWKGKLDDARRSGNALRITEAADMVVLYDSLQLAHKCILNSFYGYVMRKGARWYSMEMAGVVTHTGANIIKRANELITQVGRPLELDTDGIWCALPGSFPEEFSFVHAGTGKKFKLSYPCAMLNVMVAEHNTNDQFATLVDPEARRYETSSEMTIEFEVDGPYLAMVLPASKEEGKLIKKRYAVFNFDGSLAELKGFELKRRGELKLIKVFQGEVFDQFLLGNSLEECYAAVAAVANRWLDMLDTRGADLTDSEVVDLISETCVMSKGLDEYEGRKSCAITTATRLAQFLGDERVRDKGLVCHYVVAAHPRGTPTSERAIPVAIFSTEPSVARTYLRKWCGGDVGQGAGMPDVRDVVDWAYYRERLGSAIQKIITIPAAMQRVDNPVPRVRHPDWLWRKVAEKNDTHRQQKVDALFAAAAAKPAAPKAAAPVIGDLEDFGAGRSPGAGAAAPAVGVASAAAVEVTPGAGDAAAKAPEAEAPPAETPDRHESFSGWLAAKKTQWRAARAARKRAREAEGGAAAVRRVRPRAVDGLFAQQADAAAGAAWHVVSLAPTLQPGVYKTWAVINGRMHGVPVRVPRCFYVDTVEPGLADALRAAAPGTTVSLVKRTLPGGAEPHYTFEVRLDEAVYRDALPRLEAALSTPDVRGVYEARVSPAWSAALRVGCTASVARGGQRRGLGDVHDLSELHSVPGADPLSVHGPGALRHMTLHHSEDAARGRALYALHLPADGAAYVWVVNPARGGQREVTAAAVERVWSEARDAASAELAARPAEDEPVELPEAPGKVEVAYVRSAEAALKALQRVLGRVADRARGPTVMLLNAGDPAALGAALPALAALPCAVMPPAADDSAYPALAWQMPAARAAARSLVGAGNWLSMRLNAAAYAHLPLASIGSDWVLDTLDALYARHLRDAGHLLWSADPGQADLGGRPADLAEGLTLAEGRREGVAVAWPGAYRSVCLEVKISHLAVCAVMEAATLAELEGAALLDDSAGCGAAFRILRGLTDALLNDATRRSNICADALLRNLYRWLCSRGRLADPALRGYVASLMRKLLLQLVAELRRLGANVVHADASSIIIATGRHSPSSAAGYAAFILKTIRERELFQYLDLTPMKAYHTLLFADRYNYLGVVAPLPDSVRAGISQGMDAAAVSLEEAADELAVTAATLNAPDFDFVLSEKDYLPPAVHEVYMSSIIEFVWLPWQEAVRATLGEGAGESGPGGDDLAGLGAAQTAWLADALPGTFTDKLLRHVKNIAMHIGANDGRPAHRFPRRAGSHLTPAQLGTPALAFVRSVARMYALDSETTEAVTVLRRQLLKLIHVKEFGPDAAWRDPCLSLVLPDVVCTSCQDCRDLDLCRDPAVQRRDWRCGDCGVPRDVGAVEAALACTLRTVGESYQLQDLRCCKCGTVATQHLARQCDVCGGHLRLSTAPSAATQRVGVIRSVARYQGMGVLEELAAWYLGEEMKEGGDEEEDGGDE